MPTESSTTPAAILSADEIRVMQEQQREIDERHSYRAEELLANQPRLLISHEQLRAERDAATSIAQLARDFIWDPENWEAFQESKDSNSVAWPPEFLLLAQAIERCFGARPVEDNNEQ